jgi:hypothetical protein
LCVARGVRESTGSGCVPAACVGNPRSGTTFQSSLLWHPPSTLVRVCRRSALMGRTSHQLAPRIHMSGYGFCGFGAGCEVDQVIEDADGFVADGVGLWGLVFLGFSLLGVFVIDFVAFAVVGDGFKFGL